MQEFDVTIVGSGTSAYYVADGLRKAGKRLAMVDERPYGGTCALRGCQPKKYLVANAEAVALASDLVGRGIAAPPVANWGQLQGLKNQFLEGRSEDEVKDWQEGGVATFHGRANMVGPNEISVGEDRLRSEHIVLATGAVPRRSEFPGSEWVQDSEHFLNLPELPERIVFLGGGYISFEFAHVAKRAGAKEVTILHRSARPLKAFDPDMVDIVLASSEAAGLAVRVNEAPVEVSQEATGFKVTTNAGTTYECDLVIEATGRVPNLSVLDGGLGQVDHSSRGITVNEYLQSVSNPQVYAVGDCADTGVMLATVADEEGKTAAENLIKGNVRPIDYSVIPTAVFTLPSMGTVGKTEAEAREWAAAEQRTLRVNHGSTAGWPSSRRIGEEHAGYKVIIDEESDLILGAHLVRHNASEVINIFGLAIRFGIKASDLKNFLWAYPTMTSDLKYMVS